MKKRLLDVFVLFCMLSQWQLMNHPVDGFCLDTSNVDGRKKRFCVNDICSMTYRSFNYRPDNSDNDEITFNGDTCDTTSMDQRARDRTSNCWPSAEVNIAAFESTGLQWQEDHMTCHHMEPINGSCYYHCQKESTEPAEPERDLLCSADEFIRVVVEDGKEFLYKLMDRNDSTYEQITKCLWGNNEEVSDAVNCAYLIIDGGEDDSDCLLPIYRREESSAAGIDPLTPFITCGWIHYNSPIIYRRHPSSHSHPYICGPMQFSDMCMSRPAEGTPMTPCKSDPDITLYIDDRFGYLLMVMRDDGIHLTETLRRCFDASQPLDDDDDVCGNIVVFYGTGDCLHTVYSFFNRQVGEMDDSETSATSQNFDINLRTASWGNRPLVCYHKDPNDAYICRLLPDSLPSELCQPHPDDNTLICLRIGGYGVIYKLLDKMAEIQMEVTCSIHHQTEPRCGMVKFLGDGDCAAVTYKYYEEIGAAFVIPEITEISGELVAGNEGVHPEDGDWKGTMLECRYKDRYPSGTHQACTRYHLPGTDA